jgi:hypothetical protein
MPSRVHGAGPAQITANAKSRKAKGVKQWSMVWYTFEKLRPRGRVRSKKCRRGLAARLACQTVTIGLRLRGLQAKIMPMMQDDTTRLPVHGDQRKTGALWR